MTNKATEFIILRNGGGATTASFTATTTMTSESVSLNSIGVLTGEECEIEWGDGTVEALTGTATRSHTYTSAGDYTIRILSPENLETIDIRSNKITLNSADIKNAVNVDSLRLIGLKSGTFDSADVSSWSPNFFQLATMPAGYTGTFNSSDVSSWSPSFFQLFLMPAGYTGTFNSSDVSSWSPSFFQLFLMPAGYTGTFNSSDVSSWSPGTFQLFSMPAGYTGAFNSSDVSSWSPGTFQLFSMPAGYTGAFNSSDVSSWSPSFFRLSSMPAGYTGAFNSSDVSSWSPSFFRLSSMPAGYGFTINSGAFSSFTTTSNFQLQDNGLTSAATVSNILLGLYEASKTRTVSGGTINVGGTNTAPSGAFVAQCPPTGGKNAAYELLNDSCAALTNVWDTITFTT